MNSVNSTLRKFNILQIGMDIGGSLTKIAIVLQKEKSDLRKLFSEFGNLEEVELNDHYIYIINFSTSKFRTETIPFLKSNF